MVGKLAKKILVVKERLIKNGLDIFKKQQMVHKCFSAAEFLVHLAENFTEP